MKNYTQQAVGSGSCSKLYDHVNNTTTILRNPGICLLGKMTGLITVNAVLPV